uniref:BPTI/Kunitz inhibitor domain-containing protein n=1 Tax=Mesocestoides corti TaxID=53468 RepID=A0A5K3FDB5_MESCO
MFVELLFLSVCVASFSEADQEHCHQPIIQGPWRGSYPKWGYNAATGTCGRFIYSGCVGNMNNFETEKDCEQACQRR